MPGLPHRRLKEHSVPKSKSYSPYYVSLIINFAGKRAKRPLQHSREAAAGQCWCGVWLEGALRPRRHRWRETQHRRNPGSPLVTTNTSQEALDTTKTYVSTHQVVTTVGRTG